jgi:hypothetical protein
MVFFDIEEAACVVGKSLERSSRVTLSGSLIKGVEKAHSWQFNPLESYESSMSLNLDPTYSSSRHSCPSACSNQRLNSILNYL